MANIEIKKVEQQLNQRLLFNVRVDTAAGKMDFPIDIEDQGSAAANEDAVLANTLRLAEDLTASIRILCHAPESIVIEPA
jgi:hypothetical protein